MTKNPLLKNIRIVEGDSSLTLRMTRLYEGDSSTPLRSAQDDRRIKQFQFCVMHDAFCSLRRRSSFPFFPY